MNYLGHYNQHAVLEKFSQEDIFSWCLKDVVSTGRKYCNPLRDDRNPACYFIYDPSGMLWFWDWASVPNHFNCFQFYSRMFGVPGRLLYEHMLENIDDCAIYGTGIGHSPCVRKRKMSSKTDIDILEKDWDNDELRYWDQYGITKDQLEADNVKPLKAVRIIKDGESMSFIINNMGFAYDFGERKKIYQPYEKKMKWLTNCTANDVGNIGDLPENGYNLIITKSYKDCRVLRNLGWNCIWFQNEGMCPSADILKPLLERFSRVHVFFDNDKPGIVAAEKITSLLLRYNGMTSSFHLPEILYEKGIKDSSDFVKSISYNKLNEFIKLKLEVK